LGVHAMAGTASTSVERTIVVVERCIMGLQWVQTWMLPSFLRPDITN
jgi:hypothetical protein